MKIKTNNFIKKIIPIILLATSVSSNLLLAQATIREQGAGDRGQDKNRLEAINQVRGCRLQVVGANQAADQTIGSRRTELPIGEIRQGAKITTNYELRTTNCNNSGTDLSCYLMMNPSTLEEGTEALGEGLGFFGKTDVGVKADCKHSVNPSVECAPINHQSSSNSACSSRHLLLSPTAAAVSSTYSLQPTASIRSVDRIVTQRVEMKEGDKDKAIAQARDQSAFAKTEAIRATEQSDKAKAATEEDDNDSESSAWDRVAFKLGQASESWDKVSETLTRGNQEVASLWRKAAEKESAFAEECKQIVLAFAEGDEEKAERLDKNSWIAYHLSNAHRWLAESEGALEKGNQEIAEFWKKAATEAQEAAENWSRAAHAHVLGNTKELKHWQSVAIALGGHYDQPRGSAMFLSKVAEYLTKAAEARAEGKQEIATLWTKGADHMKAASEYEIKTLEPSKLKNKEDNEYCSNIVKYFFSSALQLKEAVTALEKSTQAEIVNQEELANLWLKISKQNQKSAEYYSQVANAGSNRNTTKICHFKQAGDFAKASAYRLEKVATSLEKATQAKEANQEEVATLWLKSVEQYKKSAEYYREATNAMARNNETDYYRFKGADSSARNSGERLGKAATAYEKVTQAREANQEEMVLLWLKIVEQYQESAEYENQAVNAFLSGNETNYDSSFKDAADSVKYSVYQLETASTALKKATQATKAGLGELAALWLTTSKQYEQSAEYHHQVANAAISRNTTDCSRFYKAGISARTSAKRSEEAAIAAENEVKYNSLNNKSSVCLPDSHKKQAEAIGANKEEESIHWKEITKTNNLSGWCLGKSASALEKALKAQEKGQNDIARLWKQSAERYQVSAGNHQRQAEAIVASKEEESIRWEKSTKATDSSGWCLGKAAELLEEALNAEEKRQNDIACLWRQAAEQYQISADNHEKQAEAIIANQEKEHAQWKKVAKANSLSAWYLEYSVGILEKAIKAQERGQDDIALLWRQVAEQYHVIADSHKKQAEAILANKKEESIHWKKSAETTRLSALWLERSVESLENDRQSSTVASMKEIEQDNLRATEGNAAQAIAREKSTRITGQIEEAKQASKENMGNYHLLWDSIVIKLEQSRDSWHKFSELLDQEKPEKALLWKKAAEESEISAEGIRRAVAAYISDNEGAAKQIEKETWGAYYLSDVFTWSLKSEEALEKATLTQSGEGNFWRELAEQYQVAADYEREASKAHDLGKEEQSNSWERAGRSAHSNADYQTKAAEAQEAGKITLAAAYREVAAISQKAAEQLKQSAEVNAAGKRSEGNSWYSVGLSLQSQADYQAKAAEAQEPGKTTLAAAYREASEISWKAAEQYQKLALAQQAIGRKDGDLSWEYAGKSVQLQADYQAKAAEAQEAGKTTLAAAYREAAETSRKAAEQHKQSVETIVVGKHSEGNSWYCAGLFLQSQVDYQVKAAETQETGRTTLAVGYREAAETSRKAAEKLKQSAEAKAAGKQSEGISWGWAGKSLQSQADYQAKAAEAQETGKTVLAVRYREAAERSRKLAEQYEQEALGHAIL